MDKLNNRKHLIITICISLCLILFIGYKYTQKPGIVKGFISWQYNDLIGTKPDVGAKIFLLPANLSVKMSNEDASAYIVDSEIPKGYYYAETNGKGNYEILDVKPGNYQAIIISNNTNRNVTDKEQVTYLKEDILTEYFNKDNINTFCLLDLKLNKFEIKDIEVKSNSAMDLSNDFGNTYF